MVSSEEGVCCWVHPLLKRMMQVSVVMIPRSRMGWFMLFLLFFQLNKSLFLKKFFKFSEGGDDFFFMLRRRVFRRYFLCCSLSFFGCSNHRFKYYIS